MYSHGYAVWFLAEAHAVVKGDKQKAVKDALTRGVKIIVDAQNSQGGWRYRPDPKDADLSVTACQIHALFAAMKAGVEVPEETLDNAIRYVRSCHDGKEGFFRYQPQGSKSNTPLALTGGAVSALAVAKAGEDEPWKRGVAFLKAAQPANSGRDTSHHPNYYYGQF